MVKKTACWIFRMHDYIDGIHFPKQITIDRRLFLGTGWTWRSGTLLASEGHSLSPRN